MAEIELNKEQRQAVEELEANILLLAPAGTGKTNTLACRIAHIIAENRALPEEILCLTFTNKACPGWGQWQPRDGQDLSWFLL